MAYCRVKTEYGINVVNLISETQISPRQEYSGFEIVTGDVTIPTDPNATFPTDWMWTGSMVDGATDGSVVRNYKTRKLNEISARTIELFNTRYFEHDHGSGSVKYSLNPDGLKYAVAISSLANSGYDYTGSVWVDFYGNQTSFTSNSDLQSWLKAWMDEALNIWNAGGALKSMVVSANNTKEAMDAIVDNR